jgi:hypothetical protein
MRYRARIFLFLLATGLATLCLTAAITFDSLQGPDLLLCYWPEYYRAMAEIEPRGEEGWLNGLLEIEPRDSAAMIRVAAVAEWRGVLPRARNLLERAARHDARYRTQWALLEFETRHPSSALWKIARRCFVMSHRDRRLLMETVWDLRPEGDFLLAEVIPDSPPVLYHFASFLMEQGDLPAARAAFARLIALPVGSASRANAGIVATALERSHLGLDLTDLHLDRRDPASAVALWKSLNQMNLVRVDGAEDAGRQVVNPFFRTEPLGRGFDWRALRSSAVEMRRADGGWRVDFPGNRPPDRVALLEQRVIVSGSMTPEVVASAPSWVRAILVEERTSRPIPSPVDGPRVARLRIEYRRPAGLPPLREPLVIRQVRWRTVQ